MTTLHNRLASLQEQMQRVWGYYQDANGSEARRELQAKFWLTRFEELEAYERELLAEIRSRDGIKEKTR